MTDPEIWAGPKLARQYALKQATDQEYYDRVWLNRARGRADDAISEEEVECEMHWLYHIGVLP